MAGDSDPREPGGPGTIPALVAWNARARPDAPALVQGRRVVTWSDLAARSSAMADQLRGRGVTPDDRITLHCCDVLTLDDMIAVVGIVHACACHAVMADQPLADRQRLIERVAPAFVIAGAAIHAPGYPVPLLRHHGGVLDGPGPGSSPSPTPATSARRPAAGDFAMIVGTSGTTAEPKIVPITHRTLVAAGRTCSDMTGLGADDRLLVLATPSFALFCIAFIPFWMGGAVVIPEGPVGQDWDGGPDAVWPTWAAASPARLALAAGSPALLTSAAAPFRFVLSAGAPSTPATEAAIAQGFRAPRVDLYGASESFSMAYDGRIATRLRIAALDGDGMAEAPNGQAGEVQVTGDLVFPGYLDAPEQTAAAFTGDGWFRTGDLGRIGPDGRLELLGRLSETINRGGLKIAPAEIEEALRGCPGVAEAVAFAVPHDALGETPALAVAVAPAAEFKLTAREIRRHLLGRLPTAKMPTRILLLDALPVTATGKLSRRELAALLAPPPPRPDGQ